MSAPERDARRSLLAGVEEAVCRVLGIASLRHRSALTELGARRTIPPGSVAAALEIVSANWIHAKQEGWGSPSKANWRWCEPQLAIAPNNTSPEVILERAIVRAFGTRDPGRWANQVPVASGVAGTNAERRRAIDLVERLDEDAFRFIELKVASDTPLYAAYEILFYLCIWLRARQQAVANSPLLAAQRIEAHVLAPASYYEAYRLNSLQAQLSREVAALGQRYGLDLTFAFEGLPGDFVIAPAYDEEGYCHSKCTD